MKISNRKLAGAWRYFTLILVVMAVFVLAGCSRGESTPEVAATATSAGDAAATEEPAVSEEATAEVAEESAEEVDAAQAESPLAQPESPLGQPESPLTRAISKPRTEADAHALAEVTHAAEPSAGMGTLSGVVFSFGTVPGGVPGTQVHLEEADEVDGNFYPPSVSLGPTDDTNLLKTTNEFGQLFMEVPPGNYYAAVWTPYDWRLAVAEVGQEAPRLITVEEGEQIDLGVIYVYWP